MPAAAAAKRRKPQVRQAQQARAVATVEAILDAAAQVLSRKGWAGFTTNAVAAKAGVSIGSLYEYFRGKEALADALLDRHLSRGEAILSTKAHAASDPDQLIDVLVESFVALHADDPRLHRALSSEVPLKPAQRARVAKLMNGVVALVASALDGRIERPRLVGQLLVDVTDALTHRWYVDHDGQSVPREALTAELKTLLNAYLFASR
jgi:AcrR family transcriptional regulator